MSVSRQTGLKFLFLAAIAAIGCRGTDSHKAAEAQRKCPEGTEGCACKKNESCGYGLTCASHLCVRLPKPTPAPTESIVELPSPPTTASPEPAVVPEQAVVLPASAVINPAVTEATAAPQEWIRIDFPYASVEFPGSPLKKTGSSKESGRVALYTPSSTKLQYSYNRDGLDLVAAEMLITDPIYKSPKNRLAGAREGILREEPGRVVKEKYGRRGKFRTLTMEIEYAASEKHLLAVAAIADGSGAVSAVFYQAGAVWRQDDEHAGEMSRRFIESFQISK